jgi:protein-S-isoprenylcysteine O-methyltransferase Ste14
MTPFVKEALVMLCFAAFHWLSGTGRIKAAVQSKTGIPNSAYLGLRGLVSLGLLIFTVVILFRNAESTARLFVPYTGFPAIVPTLFAFWVAGKALQQVAKAGRLPQFFGFQEYPRLFIFSGAYTICRHPMYAGWLVASWGILLSKPYLLTIFYNLLLTGYVIFAALSEERHMTALFGDRYRDYQKQTPFLLPYGFLKPPQHQDKA